MLQLLLSVFSLGTHKALFQVEKRIDGDFRQDFGDQKSRNEGAYGETAFDVA